ncbi:unnamed protein product [Notodromas monacha]|uniref:CHK kinase-like domain-containing protein n=1 Tax=Notodromas monacha TaxID=399045 RepID=A0A7R9GA87_9CRUS|nr:unnamed protein product [Notodromas monacha]CAG0915070.1 unnamed protein product [Notodromas monacha]
MGECPSKERHLMRGVGIRAVGIFPVPEKTLHALIIPLEGATEEETRAVMKAFAKFHANSIEIARKHQSSLADGSSRFAMLREDPFDTDAMRKAFEGTSVFETMLKALRGFPGQAENADRLERHMNKACAGNYLQYFGTLSRFVGNTKLAGFRLGDCWLNNMMFRDETSEDGSKRVAAVKLLDLQVVQYGSTIADLQYFFGASVRNEVLSKRRELIRDEYFPELMRVLSLLGSPLPDSGYSFDDFWADFQQHSEFCLVSAMFVLPIVMAQASTIPDYDTGEDLSWEAIKNVAKDAVQADCGRIAARFAHLVGIMVQEQVI